MARIALADHAKREVSVDRKRLLETLIANKKKHIEAYQEAMAGYKEEALKALEKAVQKAKHDLDNNAAAARAKIDAFDPDDIATSIDNLMLVKPQVLHLPRPVCYDKAYDSAIAMTEWDTRDALELTHAQFECFVRDIWDWSDEFTAISTMYNKKAF